jgi:hypothetical protein
LAACASLNNRKIKGRVKAYLRIAKIDIRVFEDRVGFEIAPVLVDSAEIMNWNIDGLRSVCAEIGIDWRRVLL